MGRRGPPPLPTKLKLLHGETRPSVVGRAEPQPREAAPEPPAYLSAEARALWAEVVPELEHMDVVKAVDSDALGRYFSLEATYRAAQRLVDASAVITRDDRGTFRMNPAARAAIHLALVLNRYDREFGRTPSARVSLAAPAPAGEADAAARLLS